MKDKELTVERLRELLSYDAGTGEFLWLKSRGRARAGDNAGSMHKDGYWYIRVDDRRHLAHRLSWLYVHGVWPTHEIDHINGARSDNRIANLREATSSQNKENQRMARSNNRTGLLGAYWHPIKKKFRAQIVVGGKNKHLGLFPTAEEAHEAYCQAKRELHDYCTI